MVVSLAFVLTVGPVERFRNSRKLVSYWGLNPRENSSGGRQRLDPQLRRTYQRLKKQKTSGVAKVAVARRLAVRLFWMLRTRNNYAQLVHMSGSPSSAVVPPTAEPKL
jgi:transposase